VPSDLEHVGACCTVTRLRERQHEGHEEHEEHQGNTTDTMDTTDTKKSEFVG
jgi:hypothetical protein